MSATRPPVFDERYTAPSEASRRGAHRARPNPLSSTLPLVVGAALVALVIGGAWTFIANSGTDPDSRSSVAAAPTSTQPSATSTPDASASGDDKPSASASPSDDDSTDEPSASGSPDRKAELVVLNSIRSQGLASKWATALKDDGWAIGRTGNSNQRNLTTTRVYYAKSGEKATADAVVEDLGFGESVKSPGNAEAGITVVLGQDAD